MARVLIVDNELGMLETLSRALRGAGHTLDTAQSLAVGGQLLEGHAYDGACLALDLPDGSGLDLLVRLRAQDNPAEAVILAAPGDPDGVERALRSGAWECLVKPCAVEDILTPLTRALHMREERTVREPVVFHREAIVGEGPKIRACLDRMVKAAASEVDVLFTGETGTGKELFARALHTNSARARGPFVIVDCTSLPATLAESILFGHTKGAFTGAETAREGLAREAHGGTLFLDEVGELPLDIQAKFLRVLQERRFRPVGGGRETESDFRLVAATNRDIAAMAAAGRFRQDLLFRLRAFVIELPTLRERKDDIKDLVHHYLARTGGRYRGGIKGVSPDFVQALWRHDWPGNVRELFQVLETSLASAHSEPILYPQHLPVELRVKLARDAVGQVPEKAPATQKREGMPMPEQQPWKEYRDKAMDVVERLYFQDLLAHCRGDVIEACAVSGLKPARLYQLMKKHGITRPSRRR